jgi:ClpP class serine protease
MQNLKAILVTTGGDANAAFRIARCLQQKYAEFNLFTPGWCKSAGTLIASGAHKIYMGDLGELGPLDIQISRKDEIWAQSSILNVDAAVKTLEATAKKMFFDYLYEIKQYNRAVTYRTAADIAVELTGSCSDRS